MARYAATMAADNPARDSPAIAALIELEWIRLALVADIVERGVVLRYPVKLKGAVVGFDVSANPSLSHLLKIYKLLGLTTKDLQMTPRALGERVTR